uniref:Polyprotein n=1 Tax=Peronospora matthiolae TaxID=2874970 RepID=A0AAV1V1P5_9STRA
MGGASIGNEVPLTSYTDANYAADKATRKSISAAVGTKELMGVKNLLQEMNVSVELPMQMMVDNQAAIIKPIDNEATSSAQKHVDVEMEFVGDTSSKGIVKPEC